jgi:hypothetical protein
MSAADTLTTASNVNRDKSRSPAVRSAAKAPVAAQRPFSLRGFTSMLLMLCLLMVLVSGITLYLAPRGRVANWSSWTALLLSRQQWVAVHINASVLFGVVTVTHLVMNWSRLVGYLKKRARPEIHMKRELASALAVACAILAGTILELPPISLPVEFRYDVRDSWEQTEPSAARHGPVADQVIGSVE